MPFRVLLQQVLSQLVMDRSKYDELEAQERKVIKKAEQDDDVVEYGGEVGRHTYIWRLCVVGEAAIIIVYYIYIYYHYHHKS